MYSSTEQSRAGTLAQWEAFFCACGIPRERSQSYAAKFVYECIRPSALSDLTTEDYRVELGVKLQDLKDIRKYLADPTHMTNGIPVQFVDQCKSLIRTSSTTDDDMMIVDVVKKEPHEPPATAAVRPSGPEGEHDVSGRRGLRAASSRHSSISPSAASCPAPITSIGTASSTTACADITEVDHPGAEDRTSALHHLKDPVIEAPSVYKDNACDDDGRQLGLEMDYEEMEVCDEFPRAVIKAPADEPMEQPIPLNATSSSGDVESLVTAVKERKQSSPDPPRTKPPSMPASALINQQQPKWKDTRTELQVPSHAPDKQQSSGTKKPGKIRLPRPTASARRGPPSPPFEMHHEDEFPPLDQRNALQQMSIDQLRRNGQLVQHSRKATPQQRNLHSQEPLTPGSESRSNFKRSGSQPTTRHNTRAVMQRPAAKYSCDYCDYRTSSKGHLKDHVRRHTGAKPFRCNVCSYSSAREWTLKVHLRLHTGEKPHRCDYCDYRTAVNSDLHLHKRRMHDGVKPYACDIQSCGYRAAKKAQLSAHLRKHTCEKLHKCPKCEYRSTKKGELITHIRREH